MKEKCGRIDKSIGQRETENKDRLSCERDAMIKEKKESLCSRVYSLAC